MLEVEASSWSAPVQVLLATTIVALFPAVLVLMTSFVRVSVVLGFLRAGLGLAGVPPSLAMACLALALTGFTMAPTLREISEQAWRPLMAGEIGSAEAAERALEPLRAFMLRHTGEEQIALFLRMAELPNPERPEDVPTEVLIPAFAVSELQRAFAMGFKILLPFLAIDLAVAAGLLSLGMMMLPPTLVSLPVKVLVFVLVGGWDLVAEMLVESFR